MSLKKFSFCYFYLMLKFVNRSNLFIERLMSKFVDKTFDRTKFLTELTKLFELLLTFDDTSDATWDGHKEIIKTKVKGKIMFVAAFHYIAYCYTKVIPLNSEPLCHPITILIFLPFSICRFPNYLLA